MHARTQSAMTRWLAVQTAIHDRFVHSGRVRALCDAIAPLIPPQGSIADVGCGDGQLAARLAESRPGIVIEGYDVGVRRRPFIHVHPFDGRRLPLEPDSVDGVLLIDVLHHTEDPLSLLREAVRVTRDFLIVKDHRLGRPGARTTLRLMDWVGNRGHGVSLAGRYWSEAQWRAAWDELGLTVSYYSTALRLYPAPLRPFFETGLHFLAQLTKKGR